MGIRRVAPPALALLASLAVTAVTGCSDDDDGTAAPSARPTTDADCARLLPEPVFTTLGWTPTEEGATATVRGCHRESERGYVEARRRRAEQYDALCATLDRSGTPSPGVPAPWLGPELTACATEPGADVGTTKVVVRTTGSDAWQLTVVALSATPQQQVRAALAELAAVVLERPSS